MKQTLPLGRGVTVLVRDPNGLLALNKPVGILTHPNAAGEEARSLLTVRYNPEEEAFQWEADGAQHSLFLLNRLDSATSGVLMLAEDETLAESVREQFRLRQIDKLYIARVFGRMPPAPTRWRDHLAIHKGRGEIRTKPGSGLVSETTATVIKVGRQEPATSLLRLKPHTGRSHQLRVQCSAHHVPIVGDQTYGDFRRNRDFAKATGLKRLFLHSCETKFQYEWKGRQYPFTANAPLPPEFEQAL